LGNTLDDISADAKDLCSKEALPDLAAKFETNGVLVFSGAVSAEDIEVLSTKVNHIISKASDDDCAVSDFIEETKAAKQRIHMALPLSGDEKCIKVVSSLMARLSPLLALILQCSDGGCMPLIGSGFMQTSTGAFAQELHKDVHHLDRHEDFDGMPNSWDCKLNGYPRCVSVQIQLTDTTFGLEGNMGSLQVLPGSHRPDTESGLSDLIAQAVKDPSLRNGVIPIDVVPGTVTIYSSRLWHGGGANNSGLDRQFCFFTITEDSSESAPPGLIHTIQKNDIGIWYTQGHRGLVKNEAPKLDS
jgi:ectoine hydroxylase-related dioxygenase (phytanoyl-CoA dioxygenase family)